MNAVQITSTFCPQAYLKATGNVKGLRPLPRLSVSYPRDPLRFPASLEITSCRVNNHRSMHVCAASRSGEGTSGDGKQDPMWKSFGNALESFGKKPSVEDLLKQQLEKGEFYDEGGSGNNPPRGGGGGGGGGDFDGSEDESFSGMMDETIQVMLATLGFIFVYIYIINGAEILRLIKDYIRYMFGGRTSVRLSRALYQWERFCKNLNEKKEVDRFWLEKAIINTPTLWDHPEKYRLLLKAYVQQQMRQQQSESRSYE